MQKSIRQSTFSFRALGPGCFVFLSCPLLGSEALLLHYWMSHLVSSRVNHNQCFLFCFHTQKEMWIPSKKWKHQRLWIWCFRGQFYLCRRWVIEEFLKEKINPRTSNQINVTDNRLQRLTPQKKQTFPVISHDSSLNQGNYIAMNLQVLALKRKAVGIRNCEKEEIYKMFPLIHYTTDSNNSVTYRGEFFLKWFNQKIPCLEHLKMKLNKMIIKFSYIEGTSSYSDPFLNSLSSVILLSCFVFGLNYFKINISVTHTYGAPDLTLQVNFKSCPKSRNF